LRGSSNDQGGIVYEGIYALRHRNRGVGVVHDPLVCLAEVGPDEAAG